MDLWMTERTWADELASRYGADEGQLEVVSRLASVYADRGVLRGDEGPPLYEACPHCAECWANELDEARPPLELSGVSLPWVGRRFSEARIVVAAINLRKYGGRYAQWKLYHELRENLGPQMRYRGSMVPYAVGSYVSVVEDALCGVDVSQREPPSPAEAARR